VREADSGMNANMRRMMKMMGKEDSLGLAAKPEFELNPDHGIIAGLERLRHSDEGLAKQLAGQLLDNAMVSAGLIEDPRAVFSRLNHLLEKLIPVKS